MAKVFGESGRYQLNQFASDRRQLLLTSVLVIGVLGVLEGVLISSFIPMSWFAEMKRWPFILVTVAILLPFWWWADRRLELIQKRSDANQRGAAGELAVGSIISNFPDDFYVINDLKTDFGNVDHVVVGPTGVFVLDSKNWRGVVTPDGRGELLLNGRPTDKPCIRQFMGRVMAVREKVFTLSPGVDAYFDAVFVFTAARVEAKWGTTGKVKCITDTQLHDYVVEKNFGKRLDPAQARKLAQAFLGLAHMDREFGERAQPIACSAPLRPSSGRSFPSAAPSVAVR